MRIAPRHLLLTMLLACAGACAGGGEGDDDTADAAGGPADAPVPGIDADQPTVDAAETLDADVADATPLDAPVADALVFDAVVFDAVVFDAPPPADAVPLDADTTDADFSDGGILCTPLPAAGLTMIVSGALDPLVDPTWNRPIADTCPSSTLSGVGTAVPFEVHVFCNTDAVARTVDVFMDGTDEQAALTLADPYLVIYPGTTIPADVLACAAGNDDFLAAAGTGAGVTALTVQPGASVAVVTTAFENTNAGTFALRVIAP